MGITHTWLLSPKLFSLREQTPFMANNLLALVTSHAPSSVTSQASEGA